MTPWEICFDDDSDTQRWPFGFFGTLIVLIFLIVISWLIIDASAEYNVRHGLVSSSHILESAKD